MKEWLTALLICFLVGFMMLLLMIIFICLWEIGIEAWNVIQQNAVGVCPKVCDLPNLVGPGSGC